MAESFGIDTARLKVVVLSAFPGRGDEASGFDAWLSKPIDPFHLVDEIARVATSPQS